VGACAVVAVLFYALCGCALPAKKMTPSKADHSQHHSIVRATSHHELSQTEKDKLFEDFQRWHAASTWSRGDGFWDPNDGISSEYP
jgi:hypothetical protein